MVLRRVFSHSFIRMGVVAALGWLCDALTYMSIATATGQVFWANIAGNCCGIAFTFIFGSRYAFSCRGAFSYRKFIAYAAFAFAMMPVFSGLLVWLVQMGAGLLMGKILVTIPSFVCNYLMMKWLMRHKDGYV